MLAKRLIGDKKCRIYNFGDSLEVLVTSMLYINVFPTKNKNLINSFFVYEVLFLNNVQCDLIQNSMS